MREKKPGSYMQILDLKNKLKIHNYATLNYKYSAKETTNKWTYISVEGDRSDGRRLESNSYNTNVQSPTKLFKHLR